jgi:hypothetical protein
MRSHDLIGLVGCCGPNLAYPAPARELYTSPLFRLSRAYVEARTGQWFVLSARLGVVAPEQVIEPYDQVLSEMPRELREAWARNVSRDLLARCGHKSRYLVLCGEDYASAVPAWASTEVLQPLKGLSIGRRLQFLKGATRGQDAPSLLSTEGRDV